LAGFPGIWRRFQALGEFNGCRIISDYGHTPVAVRETTAAARAFYPGRRLVLCFQPHHRNRTKVLFEGFVQALAGGGADVLVLVEVYDVAGREAQADAAVSSMQLAEAVVRADESVGREGRQVIFAPDPGSAEIELRRLLQPGDVAIIMGAGNIYRIAENLVSPGNGKR
jgi:UDP-N-acetylmuramate--alanine ligase